MFNDESDTIHPENTTDLTADIILFGGEPYTKTIVEQGPFAMNNRQEISEAYNELNPACTA